MAKKERALTPVEQKRKADFERICKEMEQRGYLKRDLTVGVLQANIMSFIVMLPFIAAAFILYSFINPMGHGAFSLRGTAAFLAALFFLIVLHEVIHGVTWGFFAKGHRNAISFGVIWTTLTPYCTCSEPLTKWQYAAGCAMPTLVLGFGPAVIAAVIGNFWLLLLSSVMILSGGGDFFILLKVLFHEHCRKEELYYDHPYECGVVAFEKK